MAASLFGSAKFIRNWRSTSNGLEAIANVHNNALLILDEIGQCDAKQIGDAAYMLSNGQGKSRMDRHGNARKPYEFSLMFLSSGEKSLADHMGTAGVKVKGGQEVRCLNLPVAAKYGIFDDLHGCADGAAFALTIRDVCGKYYGTAIPAFLEALIAQKDDCIAALRKGINKFITAFQPMGASGEVFRACQRFAVIAAAGELATHLGITGWPEKACWDATKKAFFTWLGDRGSDGIADAEHGIRQLRLFLEKHGDSRFDTLTLENTYMRRDRAGFRQSTHDGYEYFILPEVFKTEICSGYAPKVVCQVLADRGVIGTSPTPSGVRYQIKKRMPGLGPIWVYHVKPSIFDDSITSPALSPKAKGSAPTSAPPIPDLMSQFAATGTETLQ
jgi:putative DNA primase/helicase